jgi:hypothetical protein
MADQASVNIGEVLAKGLEPLKNDCHILSVSTDRQLSAVYETGHREGLRGI